MWAAQRVTAAHCDAAKKAHAIAAYGTAHLEPEPQW